MIVMFFLPAAVSGRGSVRSNSDVGSQCLIPGRIGSGFKVVGHEHEANPKRTVWV